MLERRPRSVDNSRWAEGVSVCLYKGDKLTQGDKKGLMQVQLCNKATVPNAMMHRNGRVSSAKGF